MKVVEKVDAVHVLVRYGWKITYRVRGDGTVTVLKTFRGEQVTRSELALELAREHWTAAVRDGYRQLDF